MAVVLTALGATTAAFQTPAPPATGIVAGQVVDALTGESVPDVRMFIDGGPPQRRTAIVTPADGRFVFTAVTKGTYQINASRLGYVDGAYGKQRITGSRNLALDLGEGERITNLRILMWKYAAIAGQVLDEFGDPLVGVTVTAIPIYRAGERRIPLMPRATAKTDDRGMYRIASLQPTEYLVTVGSSSTSIPSEVLQEFRNGNRALQSSLFAVSNVIGSPGSPDVQQVGSVMFQTRQGAPVPPPPSASAVTVYPTTYYAGSLTAAEAPTIALRSGELRTNIDFALRPVPAPRVSGRVVGPDGPIPFAPLLVFSATDDDQAQPAEFYVASALSDARGDFTFLGLPKGRYVIKMAKAARPQTPENPDPDWWFVNEPLVVGDSNVSDLTVLARVGSRIRGRVEYEGAAIRPTNPFSAIIQPGIGTDDAGDAGNATFAKVQPDLSFASPALPPGRRFVSMASLPRWWVKSITLKGMDIIDRPVDLKNDDLADIVVRLTDKATKLTGTVRTAKGEPDKDATVLVFPADPTLWREFQAVLNPARSFPSRASRFGVYSTANLIPGDYYLVAIPDEQADNWNWQRSSVLEALSRDATKISIALGETRSVDLTTRSIR